MQSLPIDILRIIYSYLDIDTIEGHYHATDYLDDILTTEFWIPYFLQYNLKIIANQDEVLSWIYEFRIGEILSDQIKTAPIPCKKIIGNIFCHKQSRPNSKLCDTCSNKEIVQNYAKILSTDYVNHYFTSLDTLTYSPARGVAHIVHGNVLILNDKNIHYVFLLFKHGPHKCRMEKEQLHQILFTLFEEGNIVKYKRILK